MQNLVTAVRLNNGHCGLALNYDRVGLEPKISDLLASKLRERLLERAGSEPLLTETLFQESEGPSFRSLSLALLNALSQALMTAEHLTPRGARLFPGRMPIEALGGLGTRVAVIGCGGYLVDALRADFVEEVVCSDLALFDDEAADYYGPYIKDVIDPHRAEKSIRLTDGSDNDRVVSECDLLFITGSTLSNDTLLPLLEQAGPKPAIVVEGNSAGLYPFPLFKRGVTHLVQTVVDVDYVALSHRFARQKRLGHLDMADSHYIEFLLPEMRTLERLPTFDIVQRVGTRDKKVLLLQARDWGDPMIKQEIECFRNMMPDEYELACYNLVDGPWTEEILRGFDAVMVGGSGDYGAADNQNPWFVPTTRLLRRVVEIGLPLFCSCWGHQALAVALGGRVVRDEEGYELGLLPVKLSGEGRSDSLFSSLPDTFIAPLGHSEQVVALPEEAIILASTERCRIQAYTLPGRPVYSTQFHPELTSAALWERVQAYIPEEMGRQMDDTPLDTEILIAGFLKRFV